MFFCSSILIGEMWRFQRILCSSDLCVLVSANANLTKEFFFFVLCGYLALLELLPRQSFVPHISCVDMNQGDVFSVLLTKILACVIKTILA